MQAWINVGSVDNFEVLRKRGFDLSPFKASREKQSSEMLPATASSTTSRRTCSSAASSR